MNNCHKINVLYVDDEQQSLISFQAAFRRHASIYVFTAISANEAEKILSKHTIHVLITDQKMPVKTGIEFLAETAKKYPNQTRILLTAYADKDILIDAINCGHIYMYYEKPWSAPELEVCISSAFCNFYQRQKNNNTFTILKKQNNNLKSLIRKKR